MFQVVPGWTYDSLNDTKTARHEGVLAKGLSSACDKHGLRQCFDSLISISGYLDSTIGIRASSSDQDPSMAPSKIDLEKFNGKNDFNMWKVKREALLVTQGLGGEKTATEQIKLDDSNIREAIVKASGLCINSGSWTRIPSYCRFTIALEESEFDRALDRIAKFKSIRGFYERESVNLFSEKSGVRFCNNLHYCFNKAHLEASPVDFLVCVHSYCALLFLATLMNMASQANALMPCTQSPFFDMMFPMTEEPFRVLEQTPLTIAKGADHHQTLAPARADWMETPTAHMITLDIPGMKKDNMKIEVEENRVLRVSGERKSNDYYKEGVEGEKWHRAERTFGKFWRQFRMHMSADLDHIKAHMENGILRVTVPKLAA
ncbi:SHSP domain-containing protein [Citrus sinensis]|uniref:SHSP domain-containing protein n=1 Tax=Citrus sinensis TaxID=2711 RepID=A0ACB8K745_CITSI|nr:SHSP domain-containing protein [Citrus sinensis]